jgi:V8-like Glu-specific endopeptidase
MSLHLYTVKNKYFSNSNVCNRYLPSGICQSFFRISSGFSEIDDKPEQEIIGVSTAETEFASAIRNYIRRQKDQRAMFGSYLSIADSDYKPVAFLERALRLSASVCRITQSLPFKELIPLIGKWNPKDAPEIREALEDFFKFPPKDSIWWEKYWKEATTFEDAFKRNDLEGKASESNEQILFVPCATGFLVGKSHVLTNFHVLNSDQNNIILDNFRVQFRYERNLNNRDVRPTKYKLKSILAGDQHLDYTLIEIENFPEIDLDSPQESSLSGEDLKRAKLRKEKLSFEQAGENFGWLRMNFDQPIIPNITLEQIEKAENQLGKLDPDDEELLEKSRLRGGISGEPTIIIQHPRGRAKEIVTFDSHILEASESYIKYTTDTDFGSSGSPVLNGNLQLIGLHFGALIEYDGKELEGSKSNITIKANIGTRISAVVGNLKTIENDSVKGFIRDYIDEKASDETPFRRRIFLLGGLEQNIPGDATFTKKLVEAMDKKLNKMSQPSEKNPEWQRHKKYKQFRIIDSLGDIKLFSPALNSDGTKKEVEKTLISEKQLVAFNTLRILSDPQLPLKMAIAWMNNVCDSGDGDDTRSYRPGDVALHLVTEKYESEELQFKLKQLMKKNKSPSEQKSDPLPRGILAYHVSDNRERRSHAESILDKLSEGIPELRSRGALSDFITPEGRLTFCRDLYMPSLVINLGFLENPLDQQVLGANEAGILDEVQLEKLAEVLIEAVIAWSDALNPGSFSPN